MQFLILKATHIFSVVLFLGNIITGVFWKMHADRIGTLQARAQAVDGIIHSDRWFTLPGVIVILVTGVLMANSLHLPILRTGWLLWALILFSIAGIAFQFFVAPLQRKLLENLRAGLAGNWDEAQYDSLSLSWKIWGSVGTLTPIGALFLMVTKPF
jgi:uncharacterized membrane protein